MARDTGYSVAHLSNKNERIEWTAYLQFMRNCQQIWSEDELFKMGGAWIDSPVFRYLSVIAGMLFSSKTLYRWLFSEGKEKSPATQVFTCMSCDFKDVDTRRIVIDVTNDEGYEPCPAFFTLTKGGMTVLPRLVGLSPATVDMVTIPRGCRYTIDLPPEAGFRNWLKRVATWIFSPTTAARELNSAHETLMLQLKELEAARGVLALQATQLQTAQQIGALILGDLDLDRTLATVAKTLVDVARFSASEVRTLATEGFTERTVQVGERPTDAHQLDVSLQSHGKAIGELRVWAATNDENQKQLLDTITPTITMAVDNAITYQVLADYRQNLERKVEDRTVELQRAVTDLQRAQAARDRIFANINHEIRTPLSLVGLAVEALKRSEIPAAAHQRLVTIDHNARKLLRLVDELLLLAASSEQKLEIKRAPCDLGELMRLLVGGWSPSAQARGLSLTYMGPATLVVSVDEVAIERVAANLLSNAIKFTPRGGAIQIQLSESGGRVELSVRDTGIGIDDEFKKRIFGRFEQGRAPVHPGVRGSGIGLSLVKELVEAHGGAVTVENVSAGGSRFVVALPTPPIKVAPRSVTPQLDPLDFGLEPARAPVAQLPVGNERSLPTILIAEDDPGLVDALAGLLRHDYRVLVANDGLSALQMAQAALPDLLLSDVGLPGMDGLELTRRFRQMPENRLAPVILLTAYAGAADRLSGFDSGAVDYITKPFDPTELMARVRSQLALRAMALRLHESEKLAAMGSLSAGLAHELRNPVNAVVNAIDPIRELLPPELRAPDSPVAQLLDVMKTCAEQVAHLSRQLLGFKRAGHIERHTQPFRDVVQRAIALTGPVFDKVELRNEIHYGGPVYCAAPLMTQVLANLLENAAQAAGEKGWVRMETRAENERLVLEVSDSGPGVPPVLRERIFEPFFTTKAPGQGTGLGLSTARDIVHRHQGLIEVRDHARGSVFHLEIPLYPRAEESYDAHVGLGGFAR